DTVLIDAVKGTVAARIPHVHTAESREVHDANHGATLPGALARKEGGAPATDSTVNGNYDNLPVTYTSYTPPFNPHSSTTPPPAATSHCYNPVFTRDSYDHAGATFVSSVHYTTNYNNAFWNGTQMVYGDGDGQLLTNLAIAQDVTAHELTHAVTERTSNLIYSG